MPHPARRFPWRPLQCGRVSLLSGVDGVWDVADELIVFAFVTERLLGYVWSHALWIRMAFLDLGVN